MNLGPDEREALARLPRWVVLVVALLESWWLS